MKKLVAALLLLALSGCASLPTQVDVQTGPELVGPASQEFSYYSPPSPTPGATVQEIVSGFLTAGTGPQNDYSVAREYLSEDFARRWQPSAETLIRAGSPNFLDSTGTIQLVEVNAVAYLDENGRYADVSPAQSRTLRFQMIREDGEWRISQAPNLTVVTQPVFSVVFSEFPVYFVDSRLQSLVPDLRWFPSRSSTPTQLVTALLDGPSSWLAPGVTSAIPEATGLTINAVSVEAGVARVDFDANALAADTEQRRVMLTQLRATLLQISGINQVAISVNDSPQEIEQSDLNLMSNFGSTFSLKSTGIQRVSSFDQGSLSGTESLVENYAPDLFAMGSLDREVAFANSNGVYLLERDGLNLSLIQLSDQVDLAALEFDSAGLLWLFPKDASSPVTTIDARGNRREIPSGYEGVRTDASISPEGGRLLQALEDADGKPLITLQTVTRDASISPTRLNQGLELTPVVGQPLSISWHGSNAVRVLERTASGLSALSEYPLTGPRRPLTMPPVVGQEIISGPAGVSTYLLSDTGELWVLSSNNWRLVNSGLLALSVSR